MPTCYALSFKLFCLGRPAFRGREFVSREASMQVGRDEAVAGGKQRVLGLDEWNDGLYRHYFGVPQERRAEPLVRLYITGEELKTAGDLGCSSEEARTAFIEAVKTAVDRKSLAADAVRRRQPWSPDSAIVPPFLSHLLLTCMVANDVAEDLSWTGNFRTRLCRILGTSSQPQLERLRDLWEELATWSVKQNLNGTGCRPLRLPPIPDSGHYCIIGYSLRLAIPTRRDQETLSKILHGSLPEGEEPDLASVLHVVGSNIGRVTLGFQEAFRDFTSGVERQSTGALFHTTFWTAVRGALLCDQAKSRRESSSEHVRLELEDDDGRFWLTLTSDSEIVSTFIRSEPLPIPRSSPFRFRLRGAGGAGVVDVLLSSATKVPALLSGIKAAVIEGVLVFEETDDYVFTLTRQLPSSGAVRVLVSDRMKTDFGRALAPTGAKPEITKSDHTGWSEWRCVSAEALREASFERFSSLASIRTLRRNIPRPEIKLRGGIRVGGSYVALESAFPLVEIAEATRVDLDNGESLERSPGSNEVWTFPHTIDPGRVIGTRRIIAFTDSGVLAERAIDFVKTTFSSDYKQPLDPSRWLVEATSLDMIPFSENPDCATPFTSNGARPAREPRNLIAESIPAVAHPHLARLITLLCARFGSLRGLSEGELIPIFTKELGLRTVEVWPVLRGWVEGGLLEALSDARWRGRTYFGRIPRLVVHRASGIHEAVLVGLVPPWLHDRFCYLSSAYGLHPVEARSVSEAVPALPRVRSKNPSLFNEMAEELGLSRPVRLRRVEEFLRPIRRSTEDYSSTSTDAWPRYREWDWDRRAYVENPRERTVGGISVEWCRRDDGPDRYKLYRGGNLLWWTRSRTWATLAAFTLAGVPIFARISPVTIESRGDSLHLPLPVARVVSCAAPMNSGPARQADGRAVYRYTFPDRTICDLVLSNLWPESAVRPADFSHLARDVSTILRTGDGPAVPVPMMLRPTLARIFPRRSEPRLVPATSLPRLYSLLKVLKEAGEL
jgi:hypothetical protein